MSSASLSLNENKLFCKLHRALMQYVHQQRGTLSAFLDPEGTPDWSPEMRLQGRNVLLEQPELIDQFVGQNPAAFSDDELQIVASWRGCVAGRFFIFRYLKNHTVFLTEQQPTAYGVLSLGDPLQALAGPTLPVLVETALLPFRGKIVYDGVIGRYNVTFGGGAKRNLNEKYKQAKERMGGIVTSLPATPQATAAAAPPQTRQRVTAAADVKPILQSVVGITDGFCRQHLDDQYGTLCRKLAEKLGRKRPSPLLRGKPQSWASGILRTIGWVNFLNDPTQTPHMLLGDIDRHLGTSESTGAAKQQEIRKLLKICQLDPRWTLPRNMDDNPLVWLLDLGGMIVDIRRESRELQQTAFELGLIPYIPADSGVSTD